MGMYTELIFGCKLKEETPESVIDILWWLLGESKNRPENFPDHAFFLCENYNHVFYSGSYYFGVSRACKEFWFDKATNSWHISVRGNNRNDNEIIEKFLSWIEPYISQGSGERDFYAIVCKEWVSVPIIYYLKD